MAFFPLPARTRLWAPAAQGTLRKFRIARLFGIDILLDPSWFMIILLIVLSIHTQFAMVFQGAVAPSVLWGAAIVEGLLFFGSIVVHELSHSLVARRLGVGVRSITLFIFGGVSALEDEPAAAKDEFLISGAGPLASLVLAAVSQLVSFIPPPGSFPRYFFHWLAVTNLILAIFNLLPGFPLDGGRVLRALVWKATGSMSRGTRAAGWAGTLIAYGLIGLGVLFILLGAGLINGLWFILIGWFLLGAAQSGLLEAKTRGILLGHRVRQVMTSDAPRVPGELPLVTFVDQVLLRAGEQGFLVTDNDAVVGIVTVRDLRKIPRERWPEVRIRDVMVPLSRMEQVEPGDSLLRAMEAMNRLRRTQLPVLEDGQVRGLVTREGILRAVELDLELQGSHPGP